MFLRKTKRIKDGKEHRYWSVVENRRISAKRTVQKTVLYLGEINDTERASWTRAIEALDEDKQAHQINLFPEDRTPAPDLKVPSIQLHLSRLELARPRQWGGCWLALELWDRLQFDDFWEPLLGASRKGTPWLKVLKTLVVYRLLDPGSEWKLHRCWFDNSAMADLLEDNFRLAAKDTLYRCHDLLLEHKDALFAHLKNRWTDLFETTYDILLYDLTSTYFEVDANGPIAESSDLKAFGYSRDKRPDCLQIVIALIITPDGLPIGYEVMRGNTSDKTTLRESLAGEDPAVLWRNYINLVRIEESFRNLKGDLGLRPIFHQLDTRVEAHPPSLKLWRPGIFISFLAYCLHITLEKLNKQKATGLSARSVLERFSEIQMLDVIIPTTDGRELKMKRHTKAEKLHQLLLGQLGLELSTQPPPEITTPAPVVKTF